MLVMLFLIFSSVAVTALSNPFAGLRGKMGGITGWGIVAVNAAIIAAILYIGLSLIPNLAPKQSKRGHVIFAVVIIIFAVMFAVHIRNTIGDEFIWSTKAVRGGFDYLFKAEYKNKDGETVYGILHPKHIWKFVGLSLIISWLFITFLKIGKESKQYIDIALAVIICANAVHYGVSLIRVIHLGQLISILILMYQFSKNLDIKGSKRKWIVSFVASCLLVYWISSIVFPNVGFLVFGEDKETVATRKAAAEERTISWYAAQAIIAGIALGGGSAVGLALDRIRGRRAQQQATTQEPGSGTEEPKEKQEKASPKGTEGEQVKVNEKR